MADSVPALVERLNDLTVLAERHIAKVKLTEEGDQYCDGCGEMWNGDDHDCVWLFMETLIKALREAASRLAEGTRGVTELVIAAI